MNSPEKHSREAAKAALDRILAAVRAEIVAGNITVCESISWLTYASLRDEAYETAKDAAENGDLEDSGHSVKDEIDDWEEMFKDGSQEFETTMEGLARDVGTEFDPDYEKAIDITQPHISWLL